MPTLADLYNSRHASESAAPSSSRHVSSASSSSLADLYNKAHNAEARKAKASSTSLSDLYNKRYESEQGESSVDSVVEAHPRSHRVVQPKSRDRESERSAVRESFPRAVSIDESSEGGTPEPASLITSESDELEEDDDVADEIAFHSTSIGSSRGPSRTRSVSVAGRRETPAEVVYVPRSNVTRRGALGSSASRVAMDSDDDMDIAKVHETDLLSASGGSSQSLARPHASPSRLVVRSTESSLGPRSGLSTPPIGPKDRKGKGVAHLPGSTQEEDFLDFSGSLGSIAESHHGKNKHDASSSGPPRLSQNAVGISDDVVVISDSSFEESPTGPPIQDHDDAGESGSPTSRPKPSHSEDNEANEYLISKRKRIAAQQNSDDYDREPSHIMERPLSASVHRNAPGAVRQNPIGVSDTPITTNARIAEMLAAESSANATEDDSDAHRGRYPRRARNVTDYNVMRAFERLERDQDDAIEIASATIGNVHPVERPKKTLLPVVHAAPQFLEAINSARSSHAGTRALSFADFLTSQTKARPVEASPSSPSSTRDDYTTGPLTMAQARAILKPTIGPRPLWDITVNTEDRASLGHLKASTRRWLGINDPDLIQSDANSSDEADHESTPVTGVPLGLKLRSIFTFNRKNYRPTASHLREMFSSLDNSGSIGRPKDAASLETEKRRLRNGRSYKQPLPSTLQVFSDMEHQEWVRLEEHLADVTRMDEEQKAREQGRILVEVESEDWVQTQFDSEGRKRVSTLRCCTGGQIKVYFDHKQSEAAETQSDDEESQRFEIVRMKSPTKSPFRSRLASAPVRASDEESGDGADMDEEEQDFERPVVSDVMTRSDPSTSGRRPNAPLQQVNSTTIGTDSRGETNEHTRPTITATAVPAKPSAAKGKRDLLSYFGTQSSPSQALTESSTTAKPPSTATPAPMTKSSTSLKPATAPKRAAVANLVGPDKPTKDKNRELDHDFKVYPASSRNPDLDSVIVIDLTRSSSGASEAIGKGKRPRSTSPDVLSANERPTVQGVLKKPKAVVGLISSAGAETVSGGSKGKSRSGEAVPSVPKAKRRPLPPLPPQQQQGPSKGKARQQDSGSEDEVDWRSALSPTFPLMEPPSRRGKIGDHMSAPKRKRAEHTTSQRTGTSHETLKASSFKALPHSSTSKPPPALAFTPPTKPSSAARSNAISSSSGSNLAATTRPPQATPSPTRGGWKGISGWYTNTRDAFSPTPDQVNLESSRLSSSGKSQRGLANRNRQSKINLLMLGNKKQRK
ncbi:hypothetical protein PHSY_003002 [Pseudozyma hubeiensis SY62]|uniref:Uncharacterized protein n=1 Tax=Pseudozyma hubeiensis (strain SY62) TaxID=1305764 RepID=R9P297_PSEHS|nr:hypothetical protein PHSY_003002 [Pseudozyma hubeiensis SY62]GAC95426.1 hypothetical protein PHSY_003002 [Pseudozyma hubeiensis SY62]